MKATLKDEFPESGCSCTILVNRKPQPPWYNESLRVIFAVQRFQKEGCTTYIAMCKIIDKVTHKVIDKSSAKVGRAIYQKR